MQIAAQPPALLLASGDEPLARVLHLARERDGARGGARAMREVLEQPAVGLAELLAVGARADQQRPDPLARMHERQPQRDPRHRLAAFRHRRPLLPGELDGDVRDPQRVGDRIGHHRQDVGGCHGLAETAPERRDGCVRLVALSVQQAVDPALQPVAHRVERDGHECRRRQRDAELDLLAEQMPGDHDRRDVRAPEQQGEPRQHQRPVDVHVESVQPIAQDRHGHGRQRARRARARRPPRRRRMRAAPATPRWSMRRSRPRPPRLPSPAAEPADAPRRWRCGSAARARWRRRPLRSGAGASPARADPQRCERSHPRRTGCPGRRDPRPLRASR